MGLFPARQLGGAWDQLGWGREGGGRGEGREPSGLFQLLILGHENPGWPEDQMSLQGGVDVSACAQASGTLGDLCTGLYWI